MEDKLDGVHFQHTDASCGPAALAAASRALGRAVGQGAFAKAGGFWVSGGDEDSVQRALLAKGFVPDVYRTNDPRAAAVWLRVQLMAGRPVLVCLLAESHWCCLLGVLGKRYVLFDPGRWEYRLNSGVAIVSWDWLRRRWRAGGTANRRAGQTYFGLAVYDPQ